MAGARRHALYIGQRQSALRLVIGRALRITLEHLGDIALAGGDNHQIAFPRIGFEVFDPGIMNGQLTTAMFEFRQPARNLDALIDALGLAVEFSIPLDGLAAIGCRHHEIDRIDGGAAVAPEVQTEFALILQGVIEHALAGQNPTGGNLFCRSVLYDVNRVPRIQQATGELQSGLAAANNGETALLRHFHSPCFLKFRCDVPVY